MELLGIDDSKKLSKKKREKIYAEIVNRSLAVGLGMIAVDKINNMGIATANRLAMKQALDNLPITPDFVLIDSIAIDGLGYTNMSVPRGDGHCYSIAAASIIAKVTRDRLMVKLSREYPEYGLEEHKGYGTSQHKNAVSKYGYSDIHRTNFRFHQDRAEGNII